MNKLAIAAVTLALAFASNVTLADGAAAGDNGMSRADSHAPSSTTSKPAGGAGLSVGEMRKVKLPGSSGDRNRNFGNRSASPDVSIADADRTSDACLSLSPGCPSAP